MFFVYITEPQQYENVEVSPAQPSANPDQDKTDFTMTENSAYGEHSAAPVPAQEDDGFLIRSSGPPEEEVVLVNDSTHETDDYDIPPE